MAPQILFDSGVPLLAICYGQQTLHQQLGGKVVASDQREFGRAFIDIVAPSALFDGLWNVGEKHQVWIATATASKRSRRASRSSRRPRARRSRSPPTRSEALQPDVPSRGRAHPDGGKLLANFVRQMCGCAGDWTMASFKEAKIANIREQVGAAR